MRKNKKPKSAIGENWRHNLAKKVLKDVTVPTSLKKKYNFFVRGSQVLMLPKT